MSVIDDLVEDFRELAASQGLVARDGKIELPRRASDPDAVRMLLATHGGLEAMAAVATYIRQVGLAFGRSNWNLSGLPRTNSSDEYHRALTLSIGSREVFWVWLSRSSGKVVGWALLVESDGEPFTSEIRLPNGVAQQISSHGTFLVGDDVHQLAALGTLWEKARVACERRRSTNPRRRNAWHNVALANVVLGCLDAEDQTSNPPEDDASEFAREYVTTSTKARKYQRRLRQALLQRHNPPKCQVCDLAREEVLDAAHIVADAAGGAMSTDNALLLCANHHRALDRGLLFWNSVSEAFSWNPDVEEF